MSSSHSALQRLGNRFTLVLVIVAVSLVILEFVIHRHGEIAPKICRFFRPFMAFFAFLFIVVGGQMAAAVAMRRRIITMMSDLLTSLPPGALMMLATIPLVLVPHHCASDRGCSGAIAFRHSA